MQLGISTFSSTYITTTIKISTYTRNEKNPDNSGSSGSDSSLPRTKPYRGTDRQSLQISDKSSGERLKKTLQRAEKSRLGTTGKHIDHGICDDQIPHIYRIR